MYGEQSISVERSRLGKKLGEGEVRGGGQRRRSVAVGSNAICRCCCFLSKLLVQCFYLLYFFHGCLFVVYFSMSYLIYVLEGVCKNTTSNPRLKTQERKGHKDPRSKTQAAAEEEEEE
jgi:hypothetical protein